MLELFGKGRAKLGNSTSRGVLGVTIVERLNGGFLDVARSVDFGLASGQCVNFFALGDHGLGLGGDGQSEGGANLVDTG